MEALVGGIFATIATETQMDKTNRNFSIGDLAILRDDSVSLL